MEFLPFVSGSVGGPGGADFFTVSGHEGDEIGVMLVTTSDWSTTLIPNGRARVTLLSPDLEEVWYGVSNRPNRFALPETGTFIMRVAPNEERGLGTFSPGAFNLGIEGINPPTPGPIALNLGDLVQGNSIKAPGDVDLFSFVGAAGDVVSVTIVETPGWGPNAAKLVLHSPFGNDVASATSNAQPEITLATTGTYLLRVWADGLLATGSYTVGLEGVLPPTPTPTPLKLGAPRAGSIASAGETDLFALSGRAGDVVRFSLKETSGWGGAGGPKDARAVVHGPDGDQVGAWDSNGYRTIQLPRTGTYLIRVYANDLVSTGSYELGAQGG